MKPTSRSAPRDIFRNPYLWVYAVAARFENVDKEYFVTDRGSRAGVLVLRDGCALLVRQYRFLIDAPSWEIPGGGVDPAETPEAAAVRECREEAGIACRAVTPLFDYDVGLDVTKAHVHIFRAEKFDELAPPLGSGETDAREWVPVGECLRRIRTGEIKDMMTIVALMHATHPELRA